jgi:hypothetical protein
MFSYGNFVSPVCTLSSGFGLAQYRGS